MEKFLEDPVNALITVRSTSSRLPKKCFLSFGEGNVLEHVIRRCLHFGLRPIVCTTRDTVDNDIEQLASQLDVECYRGPTDNKLLRWKECCEFFGLDSFHSVDADDPFFCGEEVKRSISLLHTGFDMVAPPLSSSAGGATVGYSLTAEVVVRACEGIEENADTEMMWSYVERVPNIRKTILSEPQNHVIRARMTLDYWEDYIMLEALRLIVGNHASRAEVSMLLEANPDLQRVNAFRTSEWSNNQQSKLLKKETFYE